MTLSDDLRGYAKNIIDDTEHGASHILKITSGSLHTALKKNPDADREEIETAAREYALRLIGGHRQMAPILNFCNRLLLKMESASDEEQMGRVLREFASGVTAESSEAMISIGRTAAEYIAGNRFVAHSRSSTILSFFGEIRDRDDLYVYTTQSRPGGEGRLLAGELSVAGIRAILIDDAEAMRYLKGVAALIIGADAIVPSGVINKIGTHMMTLCARELGVPVYCLTESTKIWPFDEPILSGLSSRAHQNVPGSSLFELIPGAMFTRIILESGAKSFDEIAMEGKNIRLAPDIRKLVGE